MENLWKEAKWETHFDNNDNQLGHF
jgi:hypothetical protein